ncbi:MAG TPA: cytochrome P450 [Mycobacteriales bacterium]|nr:cytochrome P450 [Mycobacteriales bacterium]
MTEAELSTQMIPEASLGERQATDDMTALLDFSSPHPRFRALTESGGFLVPMEGMAMQFDRESIEYVLHHPELFSSRVDLGLGNVRPLIPLNVDPPQHSNYRRLLDPLFSPKKMTAYEPDIALRANALIDTFVDNGSCNFTDDFADVLPSTIFLDLTGLPQERLDEFLHLRDGILHPEKLDEMAAFDPEARTKVLYGTGEKIYALFTELINERRTQPGDDVISQFLAAEVDGERLTQEDILDILFLFLIAGLDTVSDTLTCMYAFLARSPEHRQQIVDNPDCLDSAVEEMLRWEAPVPFSSPRSATEDITLPNGCPVSAGSMVLCAYGSANVDPTEYPDAHEVRFDRLKNKHITFGMGPHRCLGSHLARRELRIALREWHRRIPDYWITEGHENLVYPPGLRHVKDLMISWK